MIPNGRGQILGASSRSNVLFLLVADPYFRWRVIFGSFADPSRPFSLEHDPQVKDIAAALQFTPSEVAAYYFQVNRDAGRTRRRFEKARKLLDDMSDVE